MSTQLKSLNTDSEPAGPIASEHHQPVTRVPGTPRFHSDPCSSVSAMRNLSVRTLSATTAFVTGVEPNPPALAWSDEGVLACLRARRLVTADGSWDWDLGPQWPPSEADVPVVRLLHLHDGTWAAALASGTLLHLQPSLDRVEEVGAVPGGLVDLIRSPDEELLTLITAAETLVMMTRDFDPLQEIDLHQTSSSPTESFVNVGWGQKATQFHGTAGKTAARALPDAVQSVADWDDRRVRMAWRDDGQLWAVSFVTRDAVPVRQIRVYNREGCWQSTSEDNVSGLELALAWKPSGAWLASTQRLPHKYQVVFFEKNGLRHGQFALPYDNPRARVTLLSWNRTSEVLAVLASLPGETSPDPIQTQAIDLFTCRNHHWSLKQSWRERDRRVLQFEWDEVEPLRFHAVFTDGGHWRVQLAFNLDVSRGESSDNLSYLGNVDGSVLKVTPFRQVVVPPPMSAFELHFRESVSEVAFAPDFSSSLIPTPLGCAVQTRSGLIHLFSTAPAPPTSNQVKVTGSGGQGFLVKSQLLSPHGSFPSPVGPLQNLTWLSDDTFLGTQDCVLHILHISKLGDDFSVKHNSLKASVGIFSIASDPKGCVAAIQLEDGSIHKFQPDQDIWKPWVTSPEDGTAVTLPVICTDAAVIAVEKAFHVIGLTSRHRLYLDGKEIASNVSSFFVHSDFLLATTVKHCLRCLPLKKLLLATNEPSWESESVRALERGAKLVLAVPGDSKTILQMPRGNLEIVHPRALTLFLVKSLLNGKQYAEAMGILRRHRINLNIMVDHDPGMFKKSVQEFVTQVQDPSRLCLFVSDLSNEDCTTTMYESLYSNSKDSGTPLWTPGSNKVDDVTDLLKAQLELNEEKNILPILLCLIKNSKTDIQSALSRIDKFRVNGNLTLAEDAIQFLLLLADVNKLFDVALGMYDFDLVLFVAEKSQKDPKEYLPFLNDLKNLKNIHYRKFKIDVHLKKYKSALKHLSEDPSSEHDAECLTLIQGQRLYGEALGTFQAKSDLFRTICESYGDYLIVKKYYEDAAIIYQRGEWKIKALDAWERSLNVHYCLALAQDLKLSRSDCHALYLRLVEALKDERRHQEAAQILLDYLDNGEEAVASLVDGKHWSEASRVISKLNRWDLGETHLIPTLQMSGRASLEAIQTKFNMFTDNMKRLLVVMEMKEKMSHGLYQEADINAEDADLYSDTTSITGTMSTTSRQKTSSNPASLKTRNTQRSKSSKNRRKHERKKYSTKEGSVYEDLGLISELHEQITLLYKSTSEIGELIRGLGHIGEFELAKQIQHHQSAYLDRVKEDIPTIWRQPKGSAEEQGAHQFGPQATTADIVNQKRSNEEFMPEYRLLEPHLRIPPTQMPSSSWKLQILA